MCNLAGRIPTTASSLYARNLSSFIDVIVKEDGGIPVLHFNDELAQATLLTAGGEILKPEFSKMKSGNQEINTSEKSKSHVKESEDTSLNNGENEGLTPGSENIGVIKNKKDERGLK